MGFVVDLSGDVQQILKSPPDQLIPLIAEPGSEGPVDLADAAVGSSRDIAARRILEEILQILYVLPDALAYVSFKVRLA